MEIKLPFGITIFKIDAGVISVESIWAGSSHGGGYLYLGPHRSFLRALWLTIREYGQLQHLAM